MPGHGRLHGSVARRMRLLFIGDVVGGCGRRTLAALLPGLRERHAPDFVVVNGENAAGGVGITERTAGELFDAGADAITLGNHAYRHAEVYDYLDREERIVRPANYPKGSPGRGVTVVERDGMALGRGEPVGHAVPGGGALAVPGGRRRPGRAARQDDPRAGGHARRGHQREGGDGLAPRRARDRLRGHPHPRAHRRRPRAARRHRLLHRRGHDRRPRRGDRREEGAGAGEVPDA